MEKQNHFPRNVKGSVIILVLLLPGSPRRTELSSASDYSQGRQAGRGETGRAQVPGTPTLPKQTVAETAGCSQGSWSHGGSARGLIPSFWRSQLWPRDQVLRLWEASSRPPSPKGCVWFPGSLSQPAGWDLMRSGSCERPWDGNHTTKLPWLARSGLLLSGMLRDKYIPFLCKPQYFKCIILQQLNLKPN